MNDIFSYEQKKGGTIFTFPGKTKVLSTSPLNGGLTAHLMHALNINCMNGAYECEMLGDTYEEDLRAHVRELEIDPETATALSTAAWTELCAVEKVQYQELSVTAAVTGGIDSNGMCPGDPSSYYERNGSYEMLPPGTINVFIYINQNLTDAAMLRALMIASEAKASAVSHLLLGSCYSEEIATGSGTDGTVIASSTEGELTLTDASGHSKLGELIGKVVSSAVKQALLAHNRTSNLVLCVSLYLHLMDQLRWGLIMEREALRDGKRLLLYGLYCGQNMFLANRYPDASWEEKVLKSFSLKEQLMYILMFYIAVS